jgi:hypothetical protein
MNHGRKAVLHFSERFESHIEGQPFPKDQKNIQPWEDHDFRDPVRTFLRRRA